MLDIYQLDTYLLDVYLLDVSLLDVSLHFTSPVVPMLKLIRSKSTLCSPFATPLATMGI
jgi:hypothetical protein